MAFMLSQSLHVARPRSRRGQVPARRTRQPHSLPSRFLCAQRRAIAVHHSRLSVTAIVHARHHKNASANLFCSFVVLFSTSSTSPSIQLCLGKGEIAVFFHRRRGCCRRRWRSTRPVAIVAFPSYLFLALGPRSAAEARRVTIRGCDAIVSPEPTMP